MGNYKKLLKSSKAATESAKTYVKFMGPISLLLAC